MIYIASPYSSVEKHQMVRNYTEVSILVSKLVKAGIPAISPITYGHTLLEFEDMPVDFGFWNEFCISILSKSDIMMVYMLPGWERSKGVKAEIDFCEKNNIKVIYQSYTPSYTESDINGIIKHLKF